MDRETVRQQAMHWLVRKLNPAECRRKTSAISSPG